ncbi:MAG: class I mannose-6-phosphate isomerase [Enterobacteriaceae bacterium]
MSQQRRKSNYDKYPATVVSGYENQAWHGWSAIVSQIKQHLAQQQRPRTVLVIDCYHGVNLQELQQQLINSLQPVCVIDAIQAKQSEQQIHQMIERNLTDDRIFGVLTCQQLNEFFVPQQLAQLQEQVEQIDSGLVIVFGTGASLLHPGDILIYADMPRWEIQQRFRRGELGNWGTDNASEDFLRRYKRSFFVEWRVLDRHKTPLLKRADFLLDSTVPGKPNMISGAALHHALQQTASQPFRVVPFFDPGVWGGQWMKEKFDLDPDTANYAWCFDCVPEENSLLLQFGAVRVEIPSQDLVLLYPRELLGEKNHARFGSDFPIRFDLLDTMGGQNLSLQVHPLTSYIQQNFGMHYTQDESYYLLAAKPDAKVYLGTKTGTDPDAMLQDLEAAQRGDKAFDDERFINQFPARAHDHFLIPAGTVHCSGSDSVVLEISATPYIFTFKLWDWGRLGLDGLPRPIHLQHGRHVIQWDWNREWVEQNLINRIDPIQEGDGWHEERTGLHEREFIETRRHWFTKPVLHHTEGRVNVLNLVEGHEAIIDSPDGAFEPFIVHYAETFIIPASVGAYRIAPYGASEGQKLATIKAWVRG